MAASRLKSSTPKLSILLRSCPLERAKIFSPYFHQPPDHRTPLPAPPTFCPTSVPQPGTEPPTAAPQAPPLTTALPKPMVSVSFFALTYSMASLRECPENSENVRFRDLVASNAPEVVHRCAHAHYCDHTRVCAYALAYDIARMRPSMRMRGRTD